MKLLTGYFFFSEQSLFDKGSGEERGDGFFFDLPGDRSGMAVRFFSASRSRLRAPGCLEGGLWG